MKKLVSAVLSASLLFGMVAPIATANTSSGIISNVPSGATLLDAAKTGDTAAIDAALKAGISVNFKEEVTGNTALHLAVANNQIAIIQHLASKTGVRWNERNTQGLTPLHVAVDSNNVEVVNALLAIRGVVPSTGDLDRQNPLFYALYNIDNNTTDFRILSALLARISPNLKDIDGNAPIFLAINNMNLEALELLIGAKANLNILGPDGVSPIYMLTKEALSETIRFPGQLDQDYKGAINLLISNKANLNLRSVYYNEEGKKMQGMSAADLLFPNVDNYDIFYADLELSFSNLINWELFDIFAAAGAKFNNYDSAGFTALHYAVTTDNLQAVQKLIAAKANVNAVEKSGEYSEERGLTPALLLVENAGDNAALIMKELMLAKANVAYKDEWGRTALHIAAGSSAAGAEEIYHGVVLELVKSRAALNIRDVFKDTPLFSALDSYDETGDLASIYAIIAAKPSFILKNAEGKTVYAIAKEKNLTDRKSVV